MIPLQFQLIKFDPGYPGDPGDPRDPGDPKGSDAMKTTKFRARAHRFLLLVLCLLVRTLAASDLGVLLVTGQGYCCKPAVEPRGVAFQLVPLCSYTFEFSSSTRFTLSARL